jgi:hypothetical protein
MLFVDGMNGDDMLMHDGGARPRRTNESVARRTVRGQFRRQYLDGHDAVQLFIERLEDRAESAFADNFQDFVMVKPTQMTGFDRWRQE